jgi:hypothetical protein
MPLNWNFPAIIGPENRKQVNLRVVPHHRSPFEIATKNRCDEVHCRTYMRAKIS